MATRKKAAKQSKPKNPIDPTVLAKDVMEAFLEEPHTEKPKEKSKEALPVIRKKKR